MAGAALVVANAKRSFVTPWEVRGVVVFQTAAPVLEWPLSFQGSQIRNEIMALKRWMRELASKTGESSHSIRRRGFSLQVTGCVDDEPEEPNRAGSYVDWDQLDSLRGVAIRPASGC